MPLLVIEEDGACTFRVRVAPRSRRDGVVGLFGEALKVRLAAPPVDGKANRALQRFLAKRLDVSPSAVEILSGVASRRKRVRVTGVSAEAVRALLA